MARTSVFRTPILHSGELEGALLFVVAIFGIRFYFHSFNNKKKKIGFMRLRVKFAFMGVEL